MAAFEYLKSTFPGPLQLISHLIFSGTNHFLAFLSVDTSCDWLKQLRNPLSMVGGGGAGNENDGHDISFCLLVL